MNKVIFYWATTDNEPDMNQPLLCQTESGKLITLKDTIGFFNGDTSNPFSDWNHYVRKYKIKFWVYQSNIVSS
jgi:hypothetical protein